MTNRQFRKETQMTNSSKHTVKILHHLKISKFLIISIINSKMGSAVYFAV